MTSGVGSPYAEYYRCAAVTAVLQYECSVSSVHLQPERVLQAMAAAASVCPAEPLDSEDPLFLLYTSGSTGKPKGIVHTQAGYLLYTSLTHQVHTHTHSDPLAVCLCRVVSVLLMRTRQRRAVTQQAQKRLTDT